MADETDTEPVRASSRNGARARSGLLLTALCLVPDLVLVRFGRAAERLRSGPGSDDLAGWLADHAERFAPVLAHAVAIAAAATLVLFAADALARRSGLDRGRRPGTHLLALAVTLAGVLAHARGGEPWLSILDGTLLLVLAAVALGTAVAPSVAGERGPRLLFFFGLAAPRIWRLVFVLSGAAVGALAKTGDAALLLALPALAVARITAARPSGRRLVLVLAFALLLALPAALFCGRRYLEIRTFLADCFGLTYGGLPAIAYQVLVPAALGALAALLAAPVRAAAPPLVLGLVTIALAGARPAAPHASLAMAAALLAGLAPPPGAAPTPSPRPRRP